MQYMRAAGRVLLCLLVTLLAGCSQWLNLGSSFTASPAPQPGASAADPFFVATPNYFASYTLASAPFSPTVQFTDAQYPVSVSYTVAGNAPAGFALPAESEQAIRDWAQADPRVTIVSGVAAETAHVRIHQVASIAYSSAEPLGLVQLNTSGPRPCYEVYIATNDPATGRALTTPELEKALTHELGHVFGLGHSPDARDLMYPAPTPRQGVSHATFLTYGDAITLWTTLNYRRINWHADRPAVTPATPAVTAPAVARVRDADGPVLCAYRR